MADNTLSTESAPRLKAGRVRCAILRAKWPMSLSTAAGLKCLLPGFLGTGPTDSAKDASDACNFEELSLFSARREIVGACLCGEFIELDVSGS